MNEHAMHHQREPLGYPGAAEVAMSAAPMSIEPDPAASRPLLNAGEKIPDGAGGRFDILGRIGKGGMGEVYRADWWTSGGKKRANVAIKIMLAKDASDPKAVVRFNFECAALREIRHPNVVPVLATGIREKDSLAWMAMPLLRGKTLAEIIEQEGKLPVPWAVAIIRDVCCGLQSIHSIAIHRDIKPQNLFLCTDAVVRILDLGVSKFLHNELVKTTTGFQVGTLSFMSPEQIRNLPLDARSDLFSLSIVLYQLLTGRYPFAYGASMPGWFEVCSHIVEKQHFPPDHPECAPWLPSYIVEILNKGMAKEPSKRFRNAKEMEEVLTAALNQLAIDLGQIEPLTTFAVELAPPDPEEPPSEEAPPRPLQMPDLHTLMPRTTVPMLSIDARPPRETEVSEIQPRTTVPMSSSSPTPSPLSPAAQQRGLPYAVTDKVPEASEGSGLPTGAWGRPTMLPSGEDARRVSGVTVKRAEPALAATSTIEAVPVMAEPPPLTPRTPNPLGAPVLGFGAPPPLPLLVPAPAVARLRSRTNAVLGALLAVTLVGGGAALFVLREGQPPPTVLPTATTTSTGTATPQADPTSTATGTTTPVAPTTETTTVAPIATATAAPTTTTAPGAAPPATTSAPTWRRKPAVPPRRRANELPNHRRRSDEDPAPSSRASGRLFGTDE